ncbi:similar to Saccharomyces cerevisiae FLO5 YHR211W Lectin-like cell wall protein (flocculin) involved in flocculation [Maudiozyma saulgeensis]|uniref:Similar to Saccharomyces cerevisiae FLO5 YHR211W Lectin-like cell wall protein (Flocculin) involved in flocculation n=1 Tax=Maudiozyma saulgeensis TaxID=1789683 RepID=A0A1X7R1B6_9SACH|nr:similar to Saccharomyces cerevisiae FLO5 YHR211W Lectin-like cell wall protein (flocculin) involved in flocculation [Kazachstania saulgeensis]
MKIFNTRIQIFLFIIALLIDYCYARTCSTSNMTLLDLDLFPFSGKFLEYSPQESGQSTYDYILSFLVNDAAQGFGNFNGITDINYQLDVDNDDSDSTGTLFGNTIDISNFTLKASVYFFPKFDGYYNFEISADDAAILSIRSHYDYYCCHNYTIDASDPIGFYKNLYEDFTDLLTVTGSSDDVTTKTIYLTVGTPVLLVMTSINRSGGASYSMTITDPNGDIISDLTDYLYSGDNYSITCHTEVEVLETASVQSSTTYSTAFNTIAADIFQVPDTQTTYYVKVPETMSLGSSSEVVSSSSIVSSSTVSSGSPSSVVSSSTISLESLTGVISSSTTDSVLSSSMSASSSASSNPSSSSELNSSGSPSQSSSTVSGVTTLSELSSSLISSSTSVAYSSLNSGESSIFTYSSSDNGGEISSTTSNTTLSSQSSSTGIINEISSSLADSSTSSAYTYSNSSTVKPTTSITSKPISGSSEVIQSTEGDSNLGQKTSVTVPCTSENCQNISTQSTEYITKTSIITSTIVTECSVTENDSTELLLSTYVTEITTVATITSCPGGCSIKASKTTDSKASGASVVQETEETSEAPIKQGTSTVSMKQETSRAPSIQGTSKLQGTSSSSYVVELNENSATKSMLDFGAIFISIISGFFVL